MPLYTRKMLGLVINDCGILAAEVRTSAHGAEPIAVAEFAYPEGLSLSTPDRLGKAFADFMRTQNISTRRAIVGLPAKWLMFKEKTLPAANAETLSSMARLAAEQSFATAIDHLSVDAIFPQPTSQGVHALLAATPIERIRQLRTFAESAKLKLTAVTATTLQLASMLKSCAPQGIFLAFQPECAELAVIENRLPTALRHIPGPAGKSDPDQQRNLSLAFAQTTATHKTNLPTITWNGANIPQSAKELAQGLDVKVDGEISLRDIGLDATRQSSNAAANHFTGAAALALAYATRQKFALNFIASRLQIRKQPMHLQPVAWTAGIILTLIVASLIFWMDTRARRNELADLNARLLDMEPQRMAAESIVSQFSLARYWTSQKPSFIEPLRALTAAFPAEERIWVTNLTVRQDMKCLVSGKSADERAILNLLDHIRKDTSFTEEKLLFMRDAGANTQDVSFSITFNFIGEE